MCAQLLDETRRLDAEADKDAKRGRAETTEHAKQRQTMSKRYSERCVGVSRAGPAEIASRRGHGQPAASYAERTHAISSASISPGAAIRTECWHIPRAAWPAGAPTWADL